MRIREITLFALNNILIGIDECDLNTFNKSCLIHWKDSDVLS